MSVLTPTHGEGLDLDAVRRVLEGADQDDGAPVAVVTRGWLQRLLDEMQAVRGGGGP